MLTNQNLTSIDKYMNYLGSLIQKANSLVENVPDASGFYQQSVGGNKGSWSRSEARQKISSFEQKIQACRNADTETPEQILNKLYSLARYEILELIRSGMIAQKFQEREELRQRYADSSFSSGTLFGPHYPNPKHDYTVSGETPDYVLPIFNENDLKKQACMEEILREELALLRQGQRDNPRP